MKTIGVTLPIVIATLMFVTAWGVGMLAVKASATSTQISLDLLRQHLKVARIHDQLLSHSGESLKTHLAELPSAGAVPTPLDEVGGATQPPGKSPHRPWPSRVRGQQLSGAAGRSNSPSYLEEGLTEARPLLERLLGQFDQATRKP